MTASKTNARTQKTAVAALAGAVIAVAVSQAFAAPAGNNPAPPPPTATNQPPPPVAPPPSAAPPGGGRPPASPPKKVRFKLGTETWTTASGYSGTGQAKTIGGRTSDVWGLKGMRLDEHMDTPKRAEVFTHDLDAGDPNDRSDEFNLGIMGGTKSPKEIIFTGRRFIRGVKVCTGDENNTDNRKLKGLKLWYSTVSDDAGVTPDDSSPQEWQRPNCKVWHDARYCPAGTVARAAKFHLNSENNFYQGISLECLKPVYE